MATSTDGETWTAVTNSTFGTSSDGSSTICAIAYGNGKFVAGGVDGKMATSTDGETWTSVYDNTFRILFGAFYDIYAIAYGSLSQVATTA